MEILDGKNNNKNYQNPDDIQVENRQTPIWHLRASSVFEIE